MKTTCAPGPLADVRPAVYMLIMPRRPRGLRDAQAARPPTPYRPDGTLDPREWKIACSAANVLRFVVLGGEWWFVEARPVEVFQQGVQLEVVVRWLSPEVWQKVPASVDGYVVNVLLEGESEELHACH
jgi:hypothetical protein